jgi:hypothetical protein
LLGFPVHNEQLPCEVPSSEHPETGTQTKGYADKKKESQKEERYIGRIGASGIEDRLE